MVQDISIRDPAKRLDPIEPTRRQQRRSFTTARISPHGLSIGAKKGQGEGEEEEKTYCMPKLLTTLLGE